MVPDHCSKTIWLFGQRGANCGVYGWMRQVELDSSIPVWVPPFIGGTSHVAHEASALLEVLLDNPEARYQPRELFESAFSSPPNVLETKRVSEALASFEGMGLIRCRRIGDSRYDIRYRCADRASCAGGEG